MKWLHKLLGLCVCRFLEWCGYDKPIRAVQNHCEQLISRHENEMRAQFQRSSLCQQDINRSVESEIDAIKSRLQTACLQQDCINRSLGLVAESVKKDVLPWLGNLQVSMDDGNRKIARLYGDKYGPLGIDYLSFENHFRGDETTIKGRFALYLQHFERGKCRKILDIACGRGEMLSLLKERGFDASGIDLSSEMVSYCRSKGLFVDCVDVFEYLEKEADESWDGFFIGQLVEHLGGRDFIRLVRLCQKKLRKDGVMVLETLNPQNLAIFQSAYYIDLTHVYPIHPYVMDWLLKTDGWAVSVQVQTACPDIDYAWMGIK